MPTSPRECADVKREDVPGGRGLRQRSREEDWRETGEDRQPGEETREGGERQGGGHHEEDRRRRIYRTTNPPSATQQIQEPSGRVGGEKEAVERRLETCHDPGETWLCQVQSRCGISYNCCGGGTGLGKRCGTWEGTTGLKEWGTWSNRNSTP
ncbi:hypothetical protein NDU88_007203 [Pleurodeles waltl]|uniref:Uncharacterized protein n=1 Tax=Pleurodeles waltl TaxID=8319 RepID=A0AAV7N1F5_PLEWA|nr:hypothetical protein NDU88_007203 [Pleurodeles waltl]